MSNFVVTATPAGEILVEVDEAPADGVELLSIGDRLPSFEDACEAVRKNSMHLLKILEAIDPDEVELTCGIKVGVEGGNIFWGLAKASGEANYEVKIKWKADSAVNKQ